MDFDVIVSSIPINSTDKVKKTISYFPFLTSSGKEQMKFKIKNFFRKNKIPLEEAVSYDKLMVTESYTHSDINSIKYYLYQNLTDNSINNRLDDFMELAEESSLIVKEYTSFYNIENYDKMLTLMEKHSHLYNDLSKVTLEFCNNKALGLYEEADMLSTMSLAQLTNSILMDVTEMCERNCLAHSISSLKHLASELEFLPIDAKPVYESLKKELSVRYKGDTSKLKNDLEYIESKIENCFLISEKFLESLNNVEEGSKLIPDSLTQHHVTSVTEKTLLEDKIKLENQLMEAGFDLTKYSVDLVSPRFKMIHDGFYDPIVKKLERFSDYQLISFSDNLTSKGWTCEVPYTRIYLLKQSKCLDDIIDYRDGLKVGIKGEESFFLGYDMATDKVYLFKIEEPESLKSIKHWQYKAINFTSSVPTFENTIGIELDKSGSANVNFRTKKPNSYMNQYDAIHQVMVLNSKNKNYEGLKTDLCKMYVLITRIEKEVTYNNIPLPASIKADANKARMFAKNDFSKYMKEVQKNDSKFNFSKYFENSPYKEELENEYKIKVNLKALKTLL